MTTDNIKDKDGIPILIGDMVKARYREGKVEAIFLDNTSVPVEKAEGREIRISVKHPPKVVFTDQKGNQVSHNPSAIVHIDSSPREEADDEDKGSEKGMPQPPPGQSSATKDSVEGKDGAPIHVGDTVMTPYRGGVRQGEVEAVYMDDSNQPTELEGGHSIHVPVLNTPKVVFTTQRDKQVSHNPSALTHV